jgi:azurin/glucose/arabinose dehydrogenase
MKLLLKNNRYTLLKQIVYVILLLSPSIIEAQSKSNKNIQSQKEDNFYKLISLPIPENIALEVGGMAFLPNDKLAVSTRHGEVWIISNPYMKNGMTPKYKLFAQGLHEALGLNYIKGDLYLTQRSELTRLRDLDNDGEADEYKTVYSWPLSGNYHEYAYGPILDKEGKMVVNLNVAWMDRGVSIAKWHGWMLKITEDGKMEPFVTGLRSPAGFNTNNNGDIFYAENQGDWVGSGSITHAEKGDFMGNPAGLVWASQPNSPVKLRTEDIPDTDEPKYEVAKRVPGLKTPSVWFPHTILGVSTSGILSYDAKASMGPFEGQLFVGDQGQSKLMRVYLERIKGVYQGIVFPFREGFSSGILRMNWGSDGSMFVGMTSRGWGSTGKKEFGLQQLVWSGKMPFEMKKVDVQSDGFEVTFTQPVDEKTARNPASWNFSSFTYQYHHIYGSPVINQATRNIKAIELSPDHLKVRLVLDSMKLGYIHEIRAEGIRSADSSFELLHNYGYYTLNRLPDNDKLLITEQNKVNLPVAMPQHDMADMKMPTKSLAKNTSSQPKEWTAGPDRSFTIGTKPGLKFDIETLTVKAGMKVKIVFNNNDDMLHNLVITKPETADNVGLLATKMGLNGERLNYIPKSSDVLFHTRILHPKESDAIYFIAPANPGDYTYICTFPGHYMVMRGVLKVTQ